MHRNRNGWSGNVGLKYNFGHATTGYEMSVTRATGRVGKDRCRIGVAAETGRAGEGDADVGSYGAGVGFLSTRR